MFFKYFEIDSQYDDDCKKDYAEFVAMNEEQKNAEFLRMLHIANQLNAERKRNETTADMNADRCEELEKEVERLKAKIDSIIGHTSYFNASVENEEIKLTDLNGNYTIMNASELNEFVTMLQKCALLIK